MIFEAAVASAGRLFTARAEAEETKTKRHSGIEAWDNMVDLVDETR